MTPETDKRAWSDHSEGILHEVVEASFARKLERERDEARDKYNQICSQTLIEVNKAHEERDEAMETLREIAAADWKTSGELRGMAKKAIIVNDNQ